MELINLDDQRVRELVMSKTKDINEFIKVMLSSQGGKKSLALRTSVFDIQNFNGFSGYNYWQEGVLIGQVHLGVLQFGGYVLYKKTYLNDTLNEEYHYYDLEGKFLHSSPSLDGQVLQFTNLGMEPNCPFVNHLYNILNSQYQLADSGSSNSLLIHSIEYILRNLFDDTAVHLCVEDSTRDQALENIYSRIRFVEMDPVLNWKERQKVFKSIFQERQQIISVKKRAHRLSFLTYNFIIFLKDCYLKLTLIKKRPLNNIKGLFHRHTIGHIQFFIRTVQNNLGLAIAMAIYGPFTFYFITQPINPHAMWAVGKVRNAYLAAIENFEDEQTESKSSTDKVKTAVAAPIRQGQVGESWQTRMDIFKALQIEYEGDLVFAARMGRIEQIENQFMIPLTFESAWAQIKTYESQVQSKLQFVEFTPEYKQFLVEELSRSIADRIYIWKKLGQFLMDHPYIVMDKDNEQSSKDSYSARALIFMAQITNELVNEIPQLQQELSHIDLTSIQAQAQKYQNTKLPSASILQSLEKNSQLFTTKGPLSTDEMRKYISLHWETLFLQQNKKQEASSFGLQMYINSVKNAAWCLQTLYSSKIIDLNNLSYRYNLQNDLPKVTDSPANKELIEHIYHFMVHEFTGIRKEMQKILANEGEVELRNEIINNVTEYIKKRDKFYRQ